MKLRLSDDKISHLSHVVYKGLVDQGLVQPRVDAGIIRREMKRAITRVLQVDAEMEEAIRRKISSYSRPIPEGTPEWDVLYDRFLREEMAKKGIQLE